MIDLKYVRNNVDDYKQNIKNRCLDIDLDSFLDMDKKIIELKSSIDKIKASKNKLSKEMPKLSPDEKSKKLEEIRLS